MRETHRTFTLARHLQDNKSKATSSDDCKTKWTQKQRHNHHKQWEVHYYNRSATTEAPSCGQYLHSVCDQLSVLLPTVPVMSLRVSSLAWVKIPATKCQNTILRVQSPVQSGQYQYLEYQYLSLEVTIFCIEF